MRVPLFDMLRRSPFENAGRHAEKVASCGPLFVKAVQSYFNGDRDTFELIKEEIRDIEADADKIKQNIRAHLPASIPFRGEIPNNLPYHSYRHDVLQFLAAVWH